MGYRDDLYRSENIVGWTGDLQSGATVFFRKTLNDGKQLFGHIAQNDGQSANVGRGRVFTTNREAFGGQYFERVVSFVEANGPHGQGASRIGFNPASEACHQRMSILAASVSRHTNLKGFDAQDRGSRANGRNTNPAHASAVAQSRDSFIATTQSA